MKIEFDTDNAAFQDYNYPAYEMARTIEAVAERVKNGEASGSIRDCNGNTIGKFEV